MNAHDPHREPFTGRFSANRAGESPDEQVLWAQVAAIAADNHGVFADFHVSGAGGRRRTIEGWARQGRVRRVRNRVYRVAGAPVSEFQPLAAAVLAGAPFVAASHFGAGWLHRSPHLVSGRLEVISFGAVHRRLQGVQVHQSDFIAAEDLTSVENIATTTPARTVLDLAAGLNLFLLAKVFRDFERRGLCSADELENACARIGGRGHAGTVNVRKVVDAARWVAPGDSDLEERIVRQLIGAGLPQPVQQHQVVVNGQVFVIDVAWVEQKVGLEVDGFESRATREALETDTVRSNALTAAGWAIYHATAKTDIPHLAQTVHRAILRE